MEGGAGWVSTRLLDHSPPTPPDIYGANVLVGHQVAVEQEVANSSGFVTQTPAPKIAPVFAAWQVCVDLVFYKLTRFALALTAPLSFSCEFFLYASLCCVCVKSVNPRRG